VNDFLARKKLRRSTDSAAIVTDWRNYDTIYTERYMGLPEDNADSYKRSSPQTNAGETKARLLILHNIENDNLHFQRGKRPVAEADAAGDVGFFEEALQILGVAQGHSESPDPKLGEDGGSIVRVPSRCSPKPRITGGSSSSN
jgi:hypothetical protein